MPPSLSNSTRFAASLVAAIGLLALAGGCVWMLVNITPWYHWRVSVPLALLIFLCLTGVVLIFTRRRVA